MPDNVSCNPQGIALSQPKARHSLQARVAWGDHVVTVGGDCLLYTSDAADE